MRPWTSTKVVMKASERAWLNPSATRRRWNASARRRRRPVCSRVRAGVVAVELPRLGNEPGGAHDVAAPSIGTHTWMAAGSTRTFSFFAGARSPPSSS